MKDAPDDSRQTGATVLVVDDYPSLCKMIAEMLRPSGYRVLTASSGEEAKALARENEGIDLLLTDIEMPGMRGDELAAWFRAAAEKTRILFMSSHYPPLQPLDPFRILQKPFSAEVLIGKVREALSRGN